MPNVTTLTTIKTWFMTNLYPTQAQFWATWDSFWHKGESIPIASVANLQNELDGKVDAAALHEVAFSGDYNDLQNAPNVAGEYQQVSEKGQPNGYVGLDNEGLISSNHLPSYVDDVIEYADYDAMIANADGNSQSGGKIFLTLDNNSQYRWSGSVHINISGMSPAAIVALFGTGLSARPIKPLLDDNDVFPVLNSADGNNVVQVLFSGLKETIFSSLYDIFATLTIAKKEFLPMACSNEDSDLEVAAGVITFRMPYGMTLSQIRANVKNAPTGAMLIVNVKQNGASILSTLLSIDASAKTSVTATTQAVISNANLTDDSEITVDINQVGTTLAGTGLKVTLIGQRI